MVKAVKVLKVPLALIDRAEREHRLPPGSGLLIATAASFVFYAGVLILIA